ncbi:MAG: 2OG-Fe(II) oxygenase [Pseudanabaenaceae cyanobacterium]
MCKGFWLNTHEIGQLLELAPQTIEKLEPLFIEGNFVSNDNGSPDSATRELTYVYYFYQEPKKFTGGKLLLYDGLTKNNNMFDKAETYKTYTPSNNTITFFPSHYLHEVLPVSCPSRNFADSRSSGYDARSRLSDDFAPRLG